MAANMADDPKMGPLADKLAMMSSELAMAAASSTEHIGDAVALTLITATGTFAVTTGLVCRKNMPQNPKSYLFTGILAGLCARPMPNGHVAFDYNAGLIVEALDMFERATGHKAEPFLEEAFIAAGRHYVASGEAEGDRLLEAFQAARREGRIN